MARTFRRPIYWTEEGVGLDHSQIASIVDYNQRTGEFPDYFTEEDQEEFTQKYIVPYQNSLEDGIIWD